MSSTALIRVITLAGVFFVMGMGKFPSQPVTKENISKWFQPLMNKTHHLKGPKGCENIQFVTDRHIPEGTVKILLNGDEDATWVGEYSAVGNLTDTSLEQDSRGGGDGSSFFRIVINLRKSNSNLTYYENAYYTTDSGANSPIDFLNPNKKYTLRSKTVCYQ